MLIDVHNKFIYFHIFKTGGTSITRMLQLLAKNTSEILYRNADASKNVLFLNAGGHYSYKEFVRLFPQFNYDEYYNFTFVRNPWARAVSMYKHEQQESYFINYPGDTKIERARSTTFKDYLMSNTWKGKAVLMDQLRYNGKIQPNFIGKFEKLTEDLPQVLGNLGMTISNDILKTHLNGSDKYKYARPEMLDRITWHYSWWYTDELINFVRDITYEDIEYFGYTFDDKRNEMPVDLRELYDKEIACAKVTST